MTDLRLFTYQTKGNGAKIEVNYTAVKLSISRRGKLAPRGYSRQMFEVSGRLAERLRLREENCELRRRNVTSECLL